MFEFRFTNELELFLEVVNRLLELFIDKSTRLFELVLDVVKRVLEVDIILEFKSLELFLEIVKRELELIKSLSLRIDIRELKSLELSNEREKR